MCGELRHEDSLKNLFGTAKAKCLGGVCGWNNQGSILHIAAEAGAC